MMKSLNTTLDLTDDSKGVALEERAKLVFTLGRTPPDIRKAFCRLARQHHPDTQAGDKEAFQVVNEVYTLLTGDSVPKRPLLADDGLLLKVTDESNRSSTSRSSEKTTSAGAGNTFMALELADDLGFA